MSNSQKNIDQLFKQKLENFAVPTQGASWKMLQLVKQRNIIRMRRIFFAKTLLGATVLFSTVLILVFSNKSINEESLIVPEHTQEVTNNTGDLTKEDDTSSEINKISNQQTSSINPVIPSLLPIEDKTSQDHSEANHSNLEPKFELNIREEKQLLTSESSTSYKDWVQTDRVTMRNTRDEGVNSTYDEYAPVISKDGSFMFFTSRKPITDKEIRQGMGKERIYYTEASTSGWTDAQLLQSPINSEKHFNSAVSLSKDGKSLFIYRDNRFGNGDLYESKLEGSKWSTPEILPSPINSEFNESTLSLSPDGNTLFFTSDRDGGYGGMDIWYTQKNKVGIWEDAKNLGSTINTESDEEGVFIHPDGKTLYFSSRGHNGMGGYDIFYTTLENGEWSKPINLGSEINTENDDVYFVLEENGTDAYYTSANPETPEKKDILKIKYNHDFHQKMSNRKHSLLEGTVHTKDNKIPIKAQVEIYDSESNVLISTLESDSETGGFSIPLSNYKDYRIHIYKKGYLYYTEEILTDSTQKAQIINKNILLDRLQNNTQFVLIEFIADDVEATLNHTVVSKLDELYQLMIINPELKIQILLEADSEEDSVVNSHQRIVDECINYLKNRGVNINRINGQVVLNAQIQKRTKNTYSLFVNIASIE